MEEFAWGRLRVCQHTAPDNIEKNTEDKKSQADEPAAAGLQ